MGSWDTAFATDTSIVYHAREGAGEEGDMGVILNPAYQMGSNSASSLYSWHVEH